MILFSIANPKVFQQAQHTGSDSSRELGLHTFPKAVLRMLTNIPTAKWLVPFSIPNPADTAKGCRGDPLPKNFAI